MKIFNSNVLARPFRCTAVSLTNRIRGVTNEDKLTRITSAPRRLLVPRAISISRGRSIAQKNPRDTLFNYLTVTEGRGRARLQIALQVERVAETLNYPSLFATRARVLISSVDCSARTLPFSYLLFRLLHPVRAGVVDGALGIERAC